MALFAALRDRIRGYVSPNPKSTRRISTQSLEQRLDRRTMKPEPRNSSWLVNKPSTGFKRSPGTLRVKGSKVVKRSHNTFTPNSNALRSSGSWVIGWLGSRSQQEERMELEDDYEGETMIEEGEEELVYSSASSVDDANDTTLVADEGSNYVKGGKAVGLSDEEQSEETLLDLEAERHKRRTALSKIADHDWTEGERALFQKLNMRGFEPILPGHWYMDFSLLPGRLFAADESLAFIDGAPGQTFRATNALNSLMRLGVRVRDRLDRGLDPEETIRREIESYIKWAYRDAELDPGTFIPCIAVAAAKPKESVYSVVARITDKLHELGRRYRDAKVHELPTLFGAVIKSTFVAMVTYDARVPGKEVRSIAMFNFKDAGHDVWNAFAVAIQVICARNYLMNLAELEGAIMESSEEEEEKEDGDK